MGFWKSSIFLTIALVISSKAAGDSTRTKPIQGAWSWQEFDSRWSLMEDSESRLEEDKIRHQAHQRWWDDINWALELVGIKNGDVIQVVGPDFLPETWEDVLMVDAKSMEKVLHCRIRTSAPAQIRCLSDDGSDVRVKENIGCPGPPREVTPINIPTFGCKGNYSL